MVETSTLDELQVHEKEKMTHRRRRNDKEREKRKMDSKDSYRRMKKSKPKRWTDEED